MENDLTAQEAERAVREVWKKVDPVFDEEGPIEGLFRINQGEGSWLVLYAFTAKRQKEIAEIKEEIQLLKCMVILLRDLTAPVYQRTIDRLNAALEEKQRGMKGAQ